MIMHIDMDAFFASIEQMVNPHLKGKPLIIGSRDKPLNTIVCAASYEAKALGIDSGIPSREAFNLCPELEFVAADLAKYIYTSEKILELLEEFSPQIEHVSIDEFALGLDGLNLKYKDWARKIKSKIKENFGITCSIGIAKTRVLAKLASKLNKPDGLVILNEEDLPELFKKTPVEKLSGIGKSLKQALNNLGIKSCWDLLSTPKITLYEHFGKVGFWLYEAVRTQKEPSVELLHSPKAPPKSVGHSYTLTRDISQKPLILAWIRLLSEMVGERLRENNLEAKTLCLYLHSLNQGSIYKQKTFYQATYDGFEIYTRCLRIVKKPSKTLKNVRLLGLTASNLHPPERPLLFPEQNRREALISALDRINAKFGSWTIFPASVIQINK